MITIDIQKSIQCNDEYALFLSFPYSDTIVSAIRKLPTRYWHKETKQWEVPTKKLANLLVDFAKFEVKLTGHLDFNATKAKNDTKNINFDFKTTPFEHQIEGFNFGNTHSKWLLADEQGLGKTKQVIDIAVSKKQTEGYKHCLIVCGVNGLKWNWVHEVATHSDETAYILGRRVKYGRKVGNWRPSIVVIGSNKDKLIDAKDLANNENYFIVTNVESLRNEDIAKCLAEQCKKGVISMVAIDEIHKCKSPNSQQAKGILKLQPEYRVAMTGTPIMNNPLDLFIILKWLGYEKHAFYAFKKHYCIMGGYGGYEVVGYRYMDELTDRLHDIMLRRLKDEVLDLPEKLYVDEFVEMGSKQAQIYKEVTAEIKANIDKIKMDNNPLAQLIRMRQATGYTGILSNTVCESAKIERTVELVEEAISNDKKVVIFSNWTQMTSPVYAELSKLCKGVVITGETADVERQVNVNHFQTNPDCKFILGTIGAMGTGLTLTAGTVVIFLDEPWTMANKQQAIDRCHRIGTTSNITVYTIMCKNTIDERIHQIVENKGAVSDAIVDGKFTGNKAELLDFLLN